MGQTMGGDNMFLEILAKWVESLLDFFSSREEKQRRAELREYEEAFRERALAEIEENRRNR